MIIKFFKGHFMHFAAAGILLINMLFGQAAGGQNLVINGNFESGNLVGFSSNYNYIPNPSGTTNAGQYGIGNNPLPFNTASFFSMGDHTTGRGNMMIVDGTNNGGNTEPAFWRINGSGEICGLIIGEPYTFSYYVKSIYNNDIAGATSADIGIKWNNVEGQSALGIIAPTSGNMLVLPPVADWQRVTYTIVPTNSCVRIEMFDRNGNLAGNDFAIDDIELLPPIKPLQLSYAIIPSSCPDANDGFIAAYGRGGKEPYSYSFNGSPYSSSILLTGLNTVSGQYITLRDGNAPPTEVSVSDISLTAAPNPLDAGPNGTSCAGQVYQLNATGGSSYTWTAIPADTSLTTPNIANPLVKPLVNTLYQVTSQVNMVRNLIFNGDFSEGSSGGNVGFGSDYFHRHANPDGLQGIYAIVSNAQAFYNDLPACTGTGGTGDQMFVADGSTTNNARVWWQEVPVQPNTNYTFTYYLQSVRSASPALIETRINNQPITGNAGTSTQTAPNATCNWQKVTYSWNSGARTSALICLFNRNLASGGNDFALDNISFSTNIVCTVSKQVTVNVSSEEAPKTDFLTHPTCRNPTGSFLIIPPFASVNDVEYSVDGIIFQDNPQFSNLLPGTYRAFYRRKSTGCISLALPVEIDPISARPPKPVISAIKHPTCDDPGGAFDILSPVGPNYEYSNDSLVDYGSDNTLGALPSGNWKLYARDMETGCVSEPLLYTINSMPSPPGIPEAVITQYPTCANPVGIVTITKPLGASLEYSVDGINFQSNPVFSNLPSGNFYVSVRDKTNKCASDRTQVDLLHIPPAPEAPTATVTIQPTCTNPTGTIVVTAPSQINAQYSIDGINWQTNKTFTGLQPNTYNLRTRTSPTGCISSFTPLVVNAPTGAPATPAASVTAQPTCSVVSGTITFSSPLGPDYQYTVNGTIFKANPIFSSLTPGTYLASVKNIVTGCVSPSRSLQVNDIPGAPPAATSTVSMQPGCYNQGTISILAPLGTQYEYSLDSVNYQDSPTFSNVLPGRYNIRTRNKVTSCISNSLGLTVNPPPSLPPTPTGVVSAQPTCAFTYGAIFVSAPIDPYFTYSIDGISFQADNHFSMLDPGLYNVRVRDYRTACVSGLLPLVVNPVPSPPEAPQGTVTFQPTCTLPTGTIVITSPTGTGLEYSLSGNPWQSGRTFSGLSPNTYQVRVRNTATNCISNQTTLVVNAISDAPASPAASVTFQPDCAVPTGTILITSPTGNEWEYSLNGTTWQRATTFSGLSPNIYNLRVRNISGGCISNSLALQVNPPPATPATPVATVNAQPDCITSSGTIRITSPTGPLLDYSVDGINFQVGMTFAGLIPGNYVVRARNNITGCISTLAPPLVINPVIQSPPAPVVNTPVTHCQFANGIQPLTATGTNLKWYNVASGGTGSPIAPVPGVALVGSTLWYVSQTNAAGCESPRSAITVNIVPVPVITVSNKVIEIQFGQSFTLPVSVSGQGVDIRWTPATGLSNPAIEKPIASPENTTTYTVLASTSQACSASDTIRVVVLKDIIVPNVFSPNGDGINDKWVIRHLEDYPAASLEIFDRYGKRFFRNNTASIPWDGTVNGKQVPAGTYYYIIKLDGKKVLNGSVTVLR